MSRLFIITIFVSLFVVRSSALTMATGACSWKNEYVRLTSRIPFVQAQCLTGHAHQVLHVSFSHNGEMFATCSKDGYVIVSIKLKS